MSGLDARGIEVGKLERKEFPEVTQEFRVHIAEEAFDHAIERGNENPGREIGGILVGEVCRDDAGPYVRVETTIDARHADEQGTELTFTHATWEHIHKEMDARHQGKRIVGWYHTHPGFGIFLSDRDVFIHRSFFNLPFQVALVYDPKSREHGVFAWRENEPRRTRRHWVGRKEHIWDGAPIVQAMERAPAEREEARMTQAETTRTPDAPDWFGWVLGSLVMLIVGGLVGWWLGGRSAAGDLEQARRELDRQGAIAAQQAIRQLNTELLGLLRQATGAEAVRGPVDDALASLDRSLRALEEAKAPENALLEIKAAVRRLRNLRDDHGRAELALQALAEAGRQGPVDPREIQRVLSQQTALLGQICVAVAETTPDKGAARRLLRNAILIDPGQKELYERKLSELEK